MNSLTSDPFTAICILLDRYYKSCTYNFEFCAGLE